MKKITELFIFLFMFLISAALADSFTAGYMIVNPDRNLFSDKDFTDCIGHLEEQSLVYAIHNAGVNGYELRYVINGTEYQKAYICVAEPRVLSAAASAAYMERLKANGAHTVDDIPLTTVTIDPTRIVKDDGFGTIAFDAKGKVKVGGGTNLRKGPGVTNDWTVVATLDKNTELTIIGYVINGVGDTWYKAKEASEGKTGFIKSNFVDLIEEEAVVTDQTAEEVSTENMPMMLLGTVENGSDAPLVSHSLPLKVDNKPTITFGTPFSIEVTTTIPGQKQFIGEIESIPKSGNYAPARQISTVSETSDASTVTLNFTHFYNSGFITESEYAILNVYIVNEEPHRSETTTLDIRVIRNENWFTIFPMTIDDGETVNFSIHTPTATKVKIRVFDEVVSPEIDVVDGVATYSRSFYYDKRVVKKWISVIGLVNGEWIEIGVPQELIVNSADSHNYVLPFFTCPSNSKVNEEVALKLNLPEGYIESDENIFWITLNISEYGYNNEQPYWYQKWDNSLAPVYGRFEDNVLYFKPWRTGLYEFILSGPFNTNGEKTEKYKAQPAYMVVQDEVNETTITGAFGSDSYTVNLNSNNLFTGSVTTTGTTIERVTITVDGFTVGNDGSDRYATKEFTGFNYVGLADDCGFTIDTTRAPFNTPGTYTVNLWGKPVNGDAVKLDTATVEIAGDNTINIQMNDSYVFKQGQDGAVVYITAYSIDNLTMGLSLIPYKGQIIGLIDGDKTVYTINIDTQNVAMYNPAIVSFATKDGKYGSKTFSLSILPVVQSIQIDNNTVPAELTPGSSVQLTAICLPAEADPSEVYWEVDDLTKAEISQDGKLTAKTTGEVNVTVYALDANGNVNRNIKDTKKIQIKGIGKLIITSHTPFMTHRYADNTIVEVQCPRAERYIIRILMTDEIPDVGKDSQSGDLFGGKEYEVSDNNIGIGISYQISEDNGLRLLLKNEMLQRQYVKIAFQAKNGGLFNSESSNWQWVGFTRSETVNTDDIPENNLGQISYYKVKASDVEPEELAEHDYYIPGLGTIGYKPYEYFTKDHLNWGDIIEKDMWEPQQSYGNSHECQGFAYYVQNCIYNYDEVNRVQINYNIGNLKSIVGSMKIRPSKNEFLAWKEKNKETLEEYEKNVKAAIIAAGIGAHIRTLGHVKSNSTMGHSFIITGIDKDGIDIIHANGTSALDYTDKDENGNPIYSRNIILTGRWTWEEYFNTLYMDGYGYRGIDYTRNFYEDLESGIFQGIANLILYNDMTLDEAIDFLSKQTYLYGEKGTEKKIDWSGIRENFINEYRNTNILTGNVLNASTKEQENDSFAGTSDLPDDLYMKQKGDTDCTLTAALMMFRSKVYLNDKEKWSDITYDGFKKDNWKSGGLSYTPIYKNNGMSISGTAKSVEGLNSKKLKELLESHQEGVVIYDHCYKLNSKGVPWPHAVFITDYENGVFYCVDPYKGEKRIPLTDSILGNNQDDILKKIDQIWYVDSFKLTKSTEENVNENTSVEVETTTDTGNIVNKAIDVIITNETGGSGYGSINKTDGEPNYAKGTFSLNITVDNNYNNTSNIGDLKVGNNTGYSIDGLKDKKEFDFIAPTTGTFTFSSYDLTGVQDGNLLNPIVEIYRDGESTPFLIENNTEGKGTNQDKNGRLNFTASVDLKEGERIHLRVRALSSMSVSGLQYNAYSGNAQRILREIVLSDKETARRILSGTSLYDDIMGDEEKFKYRIIEDAAEETALKNLLTSEKGIEIQRKEQESTVSGYINKAESLGISDDAAKLYFADCYNQNHTAAINAVNEAKKSGTVTLESLHKAAVANTTLGGYKSRRNNTYNTILKMRIDGEL